MKNDIYKKAARLIANNKEHYSCVAIFKLCNKESLNTFEHINFFNYLHGFWHTKYQKDWYNSKNPYKLERSLALLFAYEFFKDTYETESTHWNALDYNSP